VIEDILSSATLFDIVVVLVAMGMFVAGWLQGAIRQVAGSAAFLVAFVLAVGLRYPLGDFLARNWTYYDRTFNFMLAWLGLWVAFAVTFQIGIQSFYRRVVLHRRLVIVDELAGGLLGAFQVFLVVAMLWVLLDSYYATVPPPFVARDIRWTRDFVALLEDSAVVSVLQDGLIAALEALLRLLLPAGVGATSA